VRSIVVISVRESALRDRAVLLLLRVWGFRAHEDHRAATRRLRLDGGHLRVRSKFVGVSNSCRCPSMWAKPSRPICKKGPARRAKIGICFFALDSADPRFNARLVCHRYDRALRAASALGSTHRIAVRTSFRHARWPCACLATGRLVARDWRSPASSEPTEHFHLRPSGYQRAAHPGSAVAGRCAMNTLREAYRVSRPAPRSGFQDARCRTAAARDSVFVLRGSSGITHHDTARFWSGCKRKKTVAPRLSGHGDM